MRYGIIEHHEDGSETPVPFFVVDSQAPSIAAGTLGPKFSGHEAGALAWALNMLDQGFTLYAGHQSNDVLLPYERAV